MNWITASIISQITLFIYFQMVEWVNLFPWNDMSKDKPQHPLDLVFGVIQLILIYCLFKQMWRLIGIGLIFYAIWLVLQIISWWTPYFWRASEKQNRSYKRYFSKTYKFKFLTPIGNHPIPDANHVVLQLLVLIVVIITGFAFFKAP